MTYTFSDRRNEMNINPDNIMQYQMWEGVCLIVCFDDPYYNGTF